MPGCAAAPSAKPPAIRRLCSTSGRSCFAPSRPAGRATASSISSMAARSAPRPRRRRCCSASLCPDEVVMSDWLPAAGALPEYLVGDPALHRAEGGIERLQRRQQTPHAVDLLLAVLD